MSLSMRKRQSTCTQPIPSNTLCDQSKASTAALEPTSKLLDLIAQEVSRVEPAKTVLMKSLCENKEGGKVKTSRCCFAREACYPFALRTKDYKCFLGVGSSYLPHQDGKDENFRPQPWNPGYFQLGRKHSYHLH